MFYNQLGAIVIYTTYCRVFIFLKTKLKQINKQDPFQNIIKQNVVDFLEKDNVYHRILNNV